MGFGSRRFWEWKPLEEMTEAEWESLCDRCARCCLVKLEDDKRSGVFYTDVACRFLDLERCRCTVYAHRAEREPNCLVLSARTAREFEWLPETCAYRLVAEGKGLLPWHPLLSGDPNTVHRSGISVRGRVLSERHVPPNEMVDHIVVWEVEDDN
jgi:uncharacterized cysteine cluster protein YcgN (CxxCxxCC family)